jgi:alanine-glyoxylate transaminase / serine-glyoxylate transaminase / serine-pyruvate transaminase
MPDGHDADALRRLVLDRFNVSLAAGLNKLAGKAFRFGHLGYTNDAAIVGALAAVEMGPELAGVPHHAGGVDAALGYLTEGARGSEVRTTERLLATKGNGSGNLFVHASI